MFQKTAYLFIVLLASACTAPKPSKIHGAREPVNKGMPIVTRAGFGAVQAPAKTLDGAPRKPVLLTIY